MKNCTKCGVERPATEFRVHVGGRLGRHSICRGCAINAKRDKHIRSCRACGETGRAHDLGPGKLCRNCSTDTERVCLTCLKRLPLAEFSPSNKLKPKRRRANCKSCGAISARGHDSHHKKRSRARRDLLHGLKSGPCSDCGGRFHPAAMDFDHRDQTSKIAAVGNMASGRLSKLMEEISKCDLVCSNCHRVRTYEKKQFGSGKSHLRIHSPEINSAEAASAVVVESS